jgi:DNA-binding CsgD family transcriptional regulator
MLAARLAYADEAPPSLFLKRYGSKDYKASSQNWDLAFSPDGVLYVANNSGLLTFDGNNWTTYEMPDRSDLQRVCWRNDTVYTTSETQSGYWLPDGSGLLQFHPQSLPPQVCFRSPSEGLPADLPEVILRSKPSAFAKAGPYHFIGTRAEGIYVTDARDEQILLHFSTHLGLQNNLVHALYVQDSLHVWAAFDNGLVQFSIHSAMRLLATRNQIGMLQDIVLEEGNLYARTNTGYFKRPIALGHLFVRINEAEGRLHLPPRPPRAVPVGEIHWADSSFSELLRMRTAYRLSPSRYWFTGENEALLLSITQIGFRQECHLLFDDYYLNLEHRGDQIISLNDSLHVVSTVEGPLLVNTAQLMREADSRGSPFRFTRIQYKDKHGVHYLNPETGKVDLPYDFHELNIQVASSLLDQNNQISYRVKELSEHWSPWQDEGTITLQLPEARSTLLVRKHTLDGNSPEIKLLIEVHPPWYESVWAFLLYAALTSGIALLVVRYLVSREKEKNEHLANQLLENELQNKKNELGKQTSALVRKSRALNAILEELEKQKSELGERYPAKLYQRLRNLIEKEFSDDSDWKAFDAYFENAHQNFIERFRRQYADVTTGDIRICCLLRMNLSTKEIASILHISIRAVELRRYRLRKRLGLEQETNLSEFLMSF